MVLFPTERPDQVKRLLRSPGGGARLWDKPQLGEPVDSFESYLPFTKFTSANSCRF